MNPAAMIAKSAVEKQARLRARILRNTLFLPETGCRIWTKRHNNQGYPVMTIRLAGYRNPVPMFAHLRWATRLENEADKRHPSRLRLREVHPALGREEALVA